MHDTILKLAAPLNAEVDKLRKNLAGQDGAAVLRGLLLPIFDEYPELEGIRFWFIWGSGHAYSDEDCCALSVWSEPSLKFSGFARYPTWNEAEHGRAELEEAHKDYAAAFTAARMALPSCSPPGDEDCATFVDPEVSVLLTLLETQLGGNVEVTFTRDGLHTTQCDHETMDDIANTDEPLVPFNPPRKKRKGAR